MLNTTTVVRVGWGVFTHQNIWSSSQVLREEEGRKRRGERVKIMIKAMCCDGGGGVKQTNIYNQFNLIQNKSEETRPRSPEASRSKREGA